MPRPNNSGKGLRTWYLRLLFAGAAMMVVSGAALACGAETTSSPAAVSPTTLTITGAGGTTRVLNYLADAYGQQHSDLAFEFPKGSGSGGGAKGAVDGTLDLGAMSRPPKDSEMELGIEYLSFAEDKVVVVTSPDIQVRALTNQQVNDIFTGFITNWSEVGGPDKTIKVLVRDEDDSKPKVLRREIFGDTAFAEGSVVFTSESDMQKALGGTNGALGYVAYSGVRLKDLDLNVLALEGQDPADVGSAYPRSRVLGVAFLLSNAAKVKPFLDFLKIPEANSLLEDKGIFWIGQPSLREGDLHG